MHQKNNISRWIVVSVLVLAVQFNSLAQEDEESMDRDNTVWSDVIPEPVPEEADDAQEPEAAASEVEAAPGGFIPTEKINVDSAISFPVDI